MDEGTETKGKVSQQSNREAPGQENVARDPLCSAAEFKKALAGQFLKGGGRTKARTWDPLKESQLRVEKNQ